MSQGAIPAVVQPDSLTLTQQRSRIQTHAHPPMLVAAGGSCCAAASSGTELRWVLHGRAVSGVKLGSLPIASDDGTSSTTASFKGVEALSASQLWDKVHTSLGCSRAYPGQSFRCSNMLGPPPASSGA